MGSSNQIKKLNFLIKLLIVQIFINYHSDKTIKLN